MEKRSRRGEESEYYSKIDELPDEILINIIGKLNSVKQSAKISAVCQRWRNLWAFSPYLNFGKDDAMGVRSPVGMVNHALDAYKGSTVESLRIALGCKGLGPFSEVEDCLHSVRKWGEFAYNKRVQTLELDFYNMPLFSFPCSTLPVFDRLKSTSLSSIYLNDEDFGRLLSVNLETLSLRDIWGLEEVQVTAPRLKQLMIVGSFGVETIHLISAPNLQYFKHCNSVLIVHTFSPSNTQLEFPTANLSFNSVPKLSSLFLGGPLCVKESLIKLEGIGVEKLVLDMAYICQDANHVECVRHPTHFPLLGKLKQLELRFVVGHSEYYMRNLICLIINACPSLEKLTLNYAMLRGHNHDAVEYNNTTFQHPCLQVAEFIGWCGLQSELQLANYLIDTCTNLRELAFDSNPRNDEDRSWCRHYSMDNMEQPDMKAATLSAKQLMIRKSGIAYHII